MKLPDPDSDQSFMNARTILAIGITAAMLFGWQLYMNKKYGNYKAVPAVAVNKPLDDTSKVAGSENTPKNSATGATAVETPAVAQVAAVEKTTVFEDEKLRFVISSKGMEIRDVELKAYKSRAAKNVLMGTATAGGKGLFHTSLNGGPQVTDFEVTKVGDREFRGIGRVGGVTITKTFAVNSSEYSIATHVEVIGKDPAIKGVNLSIPENIAGKDESSFFNPAMDHQSAYFLFDGGKVETVVLNEKTKDKEKSYKMVDLCTVGSLYFMVGFVDKSQVKPSAVSTLNLNTADLSKSSYAGMLTYPWLNQEQTLDLNYTTFVGPKSISLLKQVDSRFVDVIDFGWFSWLARPLLEILKWFYGLTANYGVAIILLTILVRVIVLPINLMSYRSMKEMAAINPQLAAVREKYKDDSQRMNLEVMAIMKEHKVNPVAGCLPMFLQIPVFIALFRVLGNSIELYQAPFMLWLVDLSLKDPFFVLPILMTISMYIQQKMTPNTMDPAQAKMMLFLPFVFAIPMLAMPSGLTLYWFVSNLFAIIQQRFFMGQVPRTKAIEAKA